MEDLNFKKFSNCKKTQNLYYMYIVLYSMYIVLYSMYKVLYSIVCTQYKKCVNVVLEHHTTLALFATNVFVFHYVPTYKECACKTC